MEILEQVLILKNLPKVGNVKINNNYRSLLDEKETSSSFAKKLAKYFPVTCIEAAFRETDYILEDLHRKKEYGIVTILDNSYPSSLAALKDKRPVVLFYWGNLDVISKESLGIVGTRNPDEHVEKYSPNLISHIINATHPVIISGLAKGCDTIAHNVALQENAETVAVLPCGFDKLAKNKRAFCEKIVQHSGLIVSEYTPATSETRFTPVQRDSIIAGLSDRIISLQCSVKSGTMHTLEAGYAMNKPIACYMPSCMQGDYSGHIEAEKRFKAKALMSYTDVDVFMSSQIVAKADNEQISFL